MMRTAGQASSLTRTPLARVCLPACLLVSPAATPRSFARAAVASAAWYAARASAHCPRYSCCTAAACSATASISATAAHRLRVRPPFTARPTATVPLSSGEPQACSSRVEALHACRAAFRACLCRPCDDATASKAGKAKQQWSVRAAPTSFPSWLLLAGKQASRRDGWMACGRAVISPYQPPKRVCLVQVDLCIQRLALSATAISSSSFSLLFFFSCGTLALATSA